MREWLAETARAIDWGTAPEALAGVGTVSAFIVALLLLKREAGRDHGRDEDRRAQQASLVAAWVEWTEDAPGVPLRSAMPGHACVLLNSSPLPVYDVLLSFWLVGDSETRTGTQSLPLLPPGRQDIGIRRDILARWYEAEETHPHLGVELRFTDNSRRRWWRDHNGVLTDKGPWQPARSREDADEE